MSHEKDTKDIAPLSEPVPVKHTGVSAKFHQAADLIKSGFADLQAHASKSSTVGDPHHPARVAAHDLIHSSKFKDLELHTRSLATESEAIQEPEPEVPLTKAEQRAADKEAAKVA